MFQDEARFGRMSDSRRCWAPVGVRPEVSAQIVREYEYAFAAVSPHDGTLDALGQYGGAGRVSGRSVTTACRRVYFDGAGRGGLAPGQTLAGASQHETDSFTRVEPSIESGRARLGRSAGKVVRQSGVRQPGGAG